MRRFHLFFLVAFVVAPMIGCGGSDTATAVQQDDLAGYVAEHGDQSSPDAEEGEVAQTRRK